MPRRPLTDEQRNILQSERSYRRMEATRTQEAIARDTAHAEARLSTESSLASARRNRAVRSSIASTATPSNDSNMILVIIFTIAGLIIAYKLVTSPGIPGFFKGASDWIAALSTTQPLFTSVPKVG